MAPSVRLTFHIPELILCMSRLVSSHRVGEFEFLQVPADFWLEFLHVLSVLVTSDLLLCMSRLVLTLRVSEFEYLLLLAEF